MVVNSSYFLIVVFVCYPSLGYAGGELSVACVLCLGPLSVVECSWFPQYCIKLSAFWCGGASHLDGLVNMVGFRGEPTHTKLLANWLEKLRELGEGSRFLSYCGCLRE